MLREYGTPQKIRNTTDDDTFYRLLEIRAEEHPSDVIAEYRDPLDPRLQSWIHVTASQMAQTVRLAAKGLLAQGVSKGDKVVIYSATCYQWAVIDFACSLIGAITVPIYETDSFNQATGLVREVAPVCAFADTPTHSQYIEQVRDSVSSLKAVYCFQSGGLAALMERGRVMSDDVLAEAKSHVHADDIATIVYTSGSTGKPKGAELTYRNFICVVRDGWQVLPGMLGSPSRLLLFLPMAHCFARYIEYCAIGNQGTVAYIPNAKHLLTDLRSFKPTYLLGVPRVFEKVYNAASQKAGAGLKGNVFQAAAQHFIEWSEKEEKGQRHTASEKVSHAFYMRTVGSQVMDAMGSHVAWLACGGAPLDPRLAHFFNGIDGLHFIQGYGMTECAAPCLVNFENANRIGSVGKPGPGITVRLADDDELEIHGDSVFKGYFNNPEQTREAFSPDGWLKTGDLATIDDDGFVYITGRKKDLIITAGGKNVSPAPLEKEINRCPIVSHCVVIGDRKPFVAALVTLDEGMLRVWLQKNHWDPNMSVADAAHNAAVQAFIQQYVDRANASVSRAESVRKFVILPTDLSQDDGTLTPSLKVVRAHVIQRYMDVINDEVYTPRPGTQPRPSDASLLIHKVNENVRDTSSQISEHVTKTAAAVIEDSRQRLQALRNKNSSSDSSENAEDDSENEDSQQQSDHHFSENQE
jgi:long-chain acyl-CoA synthetase